MRRQKLGRLVEAYYDHQRLVIRMISVIKCFKQCTRPGSSLQEQPLEFAIIRQSGKTET